MRAWLTLVLVLGHAAAARAQGIEALARTGRWADAQATAAAMADPVAARLVLYERLLTPGAASPSEILSFLQTAAGWPRGSLSHALDRSIAAASDDDAAASACVVRTPALAAARLRCAAAFASEGRPLAAAWLIRETWIGMALDPAQENALLQRWGAALTGSDQWQRFERLAWTDSGRPGSPASRQVARLVGAERGYAAAVLALRRNDPAAPALLLRMPAAIRHSPIVMLAEARWLRLNGQVLAAVKLWLSTGRATEQAARDRLPAFWTERNALARELLRSSDPARAYAVVDGFLEGGAGPGEAEGEAEFLAGWIALDWLDQPRQAAAHFATLAALSPAAITQGRADFWLGRARDRLGDTAGAHRAYERGARWVTTFYGQLAAREVGGSDQALAERVRSARDPAWGPTRALTFLGQEPARAVLLLVAWGEAWRAHAFLLALAEDAPDPSGRALAAHLALGLGMPDVAVAIARHAGQAGVALPEAGWPAPYEPPPGPVDPALLLGVMRQESSFDPAATSPAGARGLMQLMPVTAALVARGFGEALPPGSLADPAVNMRLGTAYLEQILAEFGGAVPVALAAYNAGPNRARAWLGGRAPAGVNMIDWIESIPFDETRNYVQRCIEGIVLYAARRGGPFNDPMAPWLG